MIPLSLRHLYMYSSARYVLGCALLGCALLSVSAEDHGETVAETVVAQTGAASKDARGVQIEIAALRQEIVQLQTAGRFKDARHLMDKILQLVSRTSHERLTETEVQRYTREHSQADNVLDYHIQQQLLTVEAHGHLLRAEHLAEKGETIAALSELDAAENVHRRILGGLSEAALQRASDLRARLSGRREQDFLQQREQARQHNQQHLLNLVEQKKRRAQNIFEQRLLRITTLVTKGLYEEALSYCRNLVRDYPGDGVADAMFVEILNLAHVQRALSYKERMSDIKKEIKQRYHETLIPKAWNGWPVFADDWNERITSRDISYYQVTLPDWQLALMNKIKERMDVSFEEIDIGEALDFLSSRMGINIVVDPDVRSSGMTVTVHARHMTMANVLSWLAQQVDSQWGYFNEAVYFGATQESATITRIYDVSQVIFVPQDFPGVEMNLRAGISGNGGGGASMFANNGLDSDDEGVAPEDLIDLIQETVSPSAWEEYDDWGISVRGTVLMVSATEHTHLLVQDFINALRSSNDIQVHISAKWLNIADDFIEEIGLNWKNDGNFPTVTGSGISSNRVQDNFAFNADVSNVLPGTPTDLAQGIIGKGLNLHFAFLNAIQSLVAFEAIQARQKGRVLDHIDLTTTNGSRANAFMGRTIAYISDYDVQTGSNGGGYLDPVIGQVSAGMTLDIQPFVSSDRKYVTLDLSPDFATVEFTIANIVALQSFFSTNGRAGIPVQIFYPVELPTLHINRVRTRVTIPDRGTVLAGGFKKHLNQNSYAQIPVLGNIPFLGRLFGRRAIYESHQSLYLSVGAKIILYPELEALQ